MIPTGTDRRQATRTHAALLLAMAATAPAAAELRLSPLFSDGVVLQRRTPIAVWGWAAAGRRVRVSLADADGSPAAAGDAAANEAGRWRATLPPQQAATGLTLRVSANGRELAISDVAIGEVWVCSGQSNMQWPLAASRDGDLALLAADRPDVRLLSVHNPGSQQPMDDFPGRWTVSSPDAARQFSAVGYYFGAGLAESLGVTVGLIDNSWGGSSAEAWTPRSVVDSHPATAATARSWADREKTLDEPPERAAFANADARWRERVAAARRGGSSVPERPNPRGPALGNRRPGNLFNARVAPIAGFAARGVIWYQGESNAGRADEYRELFPAMITAWRAAWGRPELPFYWVQLADFRKESSGPSPSRWAELREAQTMTLDRLPATGQAVAIDLGEASDIHPRNKRDVANRLLRIALAKSYGLEIAHASPRLDRMKIDGAKVELTFKGVTTRLRTVDAKAVQGFVVAGADGDFRPAQAEVVGPDRVVVTSGEVNRPVAVRYAWADNPVCNLYDATGLPVTPFRTDGPRPE